MRLYEFESKRLLKAAGITIPRGVVISGEEGITAAVAELGDEVVLKAQVPVGGRGKAGGILFASGLEGTLAAASRILGKTICGYWVERLLVEEKIHAAGEIYLGVTYDSRSRCPAIIACSEGGIEIEDLASRRTDQVTKTLVDITQPFPDYLGREIASGLGLRGRSILAFAGLAKKLYQLFYDWDATTAEINPLLVLDSGDLIAADARIDIEDEALHRHPELSETFGIEPREGEGCLPTAFELEAAKIDKRDHRGVAGRVVEFDGGLGLLIGGGGASLTVFDAILDQGERPANYCEMGGNPSVRKVQDLTRLILAKPGVYRIAVIMNVVNNTRVDLVARGVIKGVIEAGRDPKDTIAVFRVPGAWEEEGYKILKHYGVEYSDRATSIDDAARRAVEKVSDGYSGG